MPYDDQDRGRPKDAPKQMPDLKTEQIKAGLERLYYYGALARAYVIPQIYSERFNPAEGLRRGTIFPELVSPYMEAYRGDEP